MLPSSSVDFWTREVYEGQRVAGSITYTSNQSLLGLFARILPGGFATVVWVVAAVARRRQSGSPARERPTPSGDEAGGVALTALLAVLLSPIAWIHHFVWFVPGLGALVADGRDRRRVVASIAIRFVLLLRLPWWGWSLLDEGPLLAPLGVLMHNAYALLALGLVLTYPLPPRARTDAPVASAHGRTRRNGTGRAVPARR